MELKNAEFGKLIKYYNLQQISNKSILYFIEHINYRPA